MGVECKLRSYRHKADLTQAEMAKKCGIARESYLRIEKGEANPSLFTAIRICAVLGQYLPIEPLCEEIWVMDDCEKLKYY